MKRYPLFKVHVPSSEALAQIKTVFDSGFINEGTQVTKLTNELQRILDAENLILMNSCTSALTLALKLAGVEPGDEVISTPMTCVATNAAIASTGAKIVWADVDPEHGMLTPLSIRAKMSKHTKAVMAVAWAGTPPDLAGLHEECDLQDVKLILDAAHAFDAYYKERPIHEWAHYTCYSFQAIKHFTTGDGGALVCLGDDDHKRSKALKWFGLDRDKAKDERGDWKGQQWDVDIEEIGFKFNMNNVSAAIGLSQVPYIDHILGKHRCNAALYDELFNGSKGAHPCPRPEGSEPSFWVYPMKVVDERGFNKRDDLLKVLNAEGIMAGVVHVSNDDYTCFKDIKDFVLPGVREFSKNQFALPCGWWLNKEDIRHIAQRVKELTQ